MSFLHVASIFIALPSGHKSFQVIQSPFLFSLLLSFHSPSSLRIEICSELNFRRFKNGACCSFILYHWIFVCAVHSLSALHCVCGRWEFVYSRFGWSEKKKATIKSKRICIVSPIKSHTFHSNSELRRLPNRLHPFAFDLTISVYICDMCLWCFCCENRIIRSANKQLNGMPYLQSNANEIVWSKDITQITLCNVNFTFFSYAACVCLNMQ